VVHCYALASMLINGQVLETEGDENGLDGLSKNVADLQTEELYKNQLGWDFDTVWTIREGQGYPYFTWRQYHTNIISATVNNEDFGSISPMVTFLMKSGLTRILHLHLKKATS
jgi:hypothetical protein